MPPIVHLVDASPYIFRAFHSLPKTIRDPSGRPVNAVYGFVGFLLRLFEEESPTHLGICFDGSLTTSFRNDLYAGYKAQREPPPPELVAQVDDSRELARLMGARTFSDDRFEADDLIATLARQALESGWKAVVVSSDKDLAQLVSEHVEWFDLARGVRFGPAEVVARFGVRPDQITDYIGLAGDSVDNIPGVRGVGPKSAVALLSRWDELEAVYAELDGVAELEIRGAKALRERLRAGRDDALLSKQLATVVEQVELSGSLDDLVIRSLDLGGLEAACGRLGFRTLSARIRTQLGG